MSFGTPLNQPFFTGAAIVAEVSRYSVGLGGHGYMVDWERAQEFRRESVPLLRDQQDTSNRPGEQSINPSGVWRRSVQSWHQGAGQSWLDRDGTSPFRFNTSKGVNPWDKYALTLLPDTSLVQSTANTNVFLAVAAGRLFMSDGAGVRATTVGGETFGSVLAGMSANPVSSLCTDGAAVYAAVTGDNVTYRSTGGSFATFSSNVPTTTNLLRYVKGRLLLAAGGALYNPLVAGTLPGALYTHPTATWTWTDATAGVGNIYLSGFANDKSIIYRTAVKADGTALDIPVVAAELPDGEVARSLTGYLGFVVVGTSLGLRFAVADSTGNLTLGSLIPTARPVLCGEGQDRFVWYGNGNFDATSSGLGRLDLSEFPSPLTPAYASDLMGTTQGDVQAVATYNAKRWFTVSGVGTWKQSTSKVTSGTMVGGRIGFGLPEKKTILDISVRHSSLLAGQSVKVDVQAEGQATVNAGTSADLGSTEPLRPMTLANVEGNAVEWTVTITGDVTLRAITLRADPKTTERNEFIYVPVLLRDTVQDSSGIDVPVAVLDEWQYLAELRDTRRIVYYQEGTVACRVILEDTQWSPWHPTAAGDFNQGTITLKLKKIG